MIAVVGYIRGGVLVVSCGIAGAKKIVQWGVSVECSCVCRGKRVMSLGLAILVRLDEKKVVVCCWCA